ncbi:ATP-binding protein [Tritonibacter mobilis]|uniref:ATP-binding protein n=1 Tax=Tritonibacter mobilis TaxID=379347 RepID=UPI000E0DA9EB|nr:ATP-binding protein [Tritonibacter mobilis]
MAELLFQQFSRFTRDIYSIRSMDKFFAQSEQQIARMLGCACCTIYLLDSDKSVLIESLAVGNKSSDLSANAEASEVPLGVGTVGTVAQTGETVVIGEVSKDPEWNHDMEAVQSQICVAMKVDSETLGVIDCRDPHPHLFDDELRILLETVAAAVAARLEALLWMDELDRINLTLVDEMSLREAVEIASEVKRTPFPDFPKAASERFLRAIDFVEEGFALWDNDERLVMLNAPMRELSGLPADILKPGLSFEDWIKKRIEYEQIPEIGSERQKWVATRVELMRSPPADPVEVQRNGRWYKLQYRKLDDGSTVQTVVDIDHQKAVEKARNQFTSTVSHELRTPLTSIIGALGLVHSGKLGPLTDDVAGALELCKRNSTRLLNLVNDILDQEAISAGQLRLDTEPTPIAQLIDDAVDLNTQYGNASGVSIKFTGAKSAFCVDADKRRVQQVFANLISNAVKFSDSGQAVEISFRLEGGLAAFSVSDKGPGIPDEFLPMLFEPFEQAERSDTRKVGGFGLGLSITKSLVEMHGGSLTHSSGFGAGATFTFTLPLAEG